MQKEIKKVLENIWFPLVMTLLEIFVISLIIFCITNFVPHSFEIIKNHNLVTWMVIVCSVKLLRYNSKEEDESKEEKVNEEPESNTITMNLDDLMNSTEELERPVKQRKVVNVKNGIYPQIEESDNDGTTRE